jgi:hypothetical protein
MSQKKPEALIQENQKVTTAKPNKLVAKTMAKLQEADRESHPHQHLEEETQTHHSGKDH